MITRYPIAIWLQDQAAPVAAANFDHDDVRQEGTWTYRPDYLARDDAFALDPLFLPLVPRVLSTRHQDGWFGVLVDAGPGHFGERLWRQRLGYAPHRGELLSRIDANGSGAVLVGELTASRLRPPPTLRDVQHRASSILDGESGQDDNADFISALTLSPTTGGAKPKIDLLDDAGHPIIAKFSDVGDAPSLPRVEAAAMAVTAACGIATERPSIAVFEGRHARREALVQPRFDREMRGDHIVRHAYASGFTVLNLSTGNEPHASYTALSHELGRWCARGAHPEHAHAQRRELWRRIVLNALIGNSDDHPRNIAVIRRAGLWQLAPAFDLVPFSRAPDQQCSLRMAYDRSGMLQRVTADDLVAAAPLYLWDRRHAQAELQRMAAIVASQFESALRHWQVPDAEIRVRMSAITLAVAIHSAQGAT